MAWPDVQINQVNQLQGETNEIERVLLYVGTGTVNTGKTLPVNSQSDLDALLGSADSPLKNMVNAAMLNAGQNWSGFVRVLAKDGAESWDDAVRDAQVVASVEGVVLTDAIADKGPVNTANALRTELLAKYGRWVWFIIAVQEVQDGESWADYLLRLSALQQGIAAPGVQLVPCLFGNEPGVLAGRLCNRAVTIADSPCRVATGAVMALGRDDLPLDGDGKVLELATLKALAAQRYSVPMWYADYDGYYWADGMWKAGIFRPLSTCVLLTRRRGVSGFRLSQKWVTVRLTAHRAALPRTRRISPERCAPCPNQPKSMASRSRGK